MKKRLNNRAAIGACRDFDNSHVFAFSLNAMVVVRDLGLKHSSNKAGKQTQIVNSKSYNDKIA